MCFIQSKQVKVGPQVLLSVKRNWYPLGGVLKMPSWKLIIGVVQVWHVVLTGLEAWVPEVCSEILPSWDHIRYPGNGISRDGWSLLKEEEVSELLIIHNLIYIGFSRYFVVSQPHQLLLLGIFAPKLLDLAWRKELMLSASMGSWHLDTALQASVVDSSIIQSYPRLLVLWFGKEKSLLLYLA